MKYIATANSVAALLRSANLLRPSQLALRRSAATRADSAFTLLELLAAMAILLIIMAALWQVADQMSKSWQLGERRTEVNQNARLVLDMIASELEGAMASSNSPTGVVGVGPSFLHDEDSGILPGVATEWLSPTPPNDQIYFISNSSDTEKQPYVDMTEYGYMVVFARHNCPNCYTMMGGFYYLLRHEERSFAGGSVNTNWDFMNASPLAGWNSDTNWTSTTRIGKDNKTPILDNVIRFELDYETRGTNTLGIADAYGTAPVDTWRNNNWSATGGSFPSDYGITNPERTLPCAVHIRLTVLDRRTAARASAIIATIANTAPSATWAAWTNGIPAAYLDCIPYSPTPPFDSFLTCTTCPWTNSVVQPLRNVLRQGVQTYYRTVNLRNSK